MNIKKIQNYGFARLMMMKPSQQMTYLLGHNLVPQRWIFILGCYNSATTLLASILRQHPLMGGLPNEGAFLTDVLPFPEQLGWPRMWSQCVEKMKIEIGPESEKRAMRIKRQWSVFYPKGAQNLIEKSVSNIVRTDFLQKYFQPAYFIYIVRNGYVVSKGIQQKANYSRWNCPFKKDGYPIEMCAQQWKVSDEIFEKNSRNLKRVLSVKYEDLTTEPEATLKTITDFLEIQPMPSKILNKKWSVHFVNSSIVNMNPTGLNRLKKEDFSKIESVAARVLKKYEYTRSN